jgi:uncharacterized protein YyaL (SSP411 family)
LFFFTDKNAEALIARKKEIFDNVIPSSNSIMARNLYTLGLLLEREDFMYLSKLMLAKMRGILLKNVDYLTNWACLATQMVSKTAEIAIVGTEYLTFRKEIETTFYPNKVLSGTAANSELPLLQNRTDKDGNTQIFVCYDKTCQLPVKSVAEAWQQLIP